MSLLVQPSHTPLDDLTAAWERFEALGVDGLWINDHFFPRWGSDAGTNFEAFTLLTAMALRTTRVDIGILVAGGWFRNPHVVADMARTIDHLSGGRMVLGLGAGWNRKDLHDYGFGDPSHRELLARFADDVPAVVERLGLLNPGPVRGRMPILIGGIGESITLPLVARHATSWNAAVVKVDGPAGFAEKSAALDRCCAEIGRDPGEIERTLLFPGDSVDPAEARAWADAGAEHFIIMSNHPFDPAPVEAVLAWARSSA